MKIDIEKILCATDFSTSAERAFQYALTLADRYGATVELLHVTEVSAYAEDNVGEAENSYEGRLRARLDEIVASTDTDVSIETRMAAGVPYAEIINRAKAMPADLIVIGTHGRTGMKHLLIGSVAEKVVRTASCPVLSVRHPDHDVAIEGTEV
ncbi:universal stress protein [Thermodesulfobacteriota bacterium]